MDYRQFTTEDFVADPYFRQWVQQQDSESRQFWENWVMQHPEKQETIYEAKFLLQYFHLKPPLPEEGDYLEVQQNIKRAINSTAQSFPWFFPFAKRTAQSVAIWKKAAAILTGITLLGIMSFFFLRESPVLTYTTSFGEMQNIVLPDSSIVTLNANSTLTLSSEWRQSREVWLEGEAYFSVKKMESDAQGRLENKVSQPIRFVVHTENLEVEVLGTRFNVNERRGMTKVVLNSGSVQLKNNSDREIVKMQPGDLVAYSNADKKFRKIVVDPGLFTSWKEGRFAFEGTSIQEIAQLLEDNYGYEVKIEGQTIAHRKFSAYIPSHDVEILLTLIAESLDVKIKKVNNKIEIKN